MSPAVRRRLSGAASAVAPLCLAALLPLVVFCFVVAYLHGCRPFNSDNLWPISFCDDVLRGADLSGWQLPCAPYLFPDMLLLLPCQWLCPNLVAVYLAYDAVFYGLLLATIYWVGRQLGLGRRVSFVSAAAGVVLALAAHLRDAYRGLGQLITNPGSHAGAVLVGLLLAGLTARALRRGGYGRAGAAVFVVCGGLGALSDKLLLVQFVLPGCLALAALWVFRRVRFGQLFRHALLVGAALLVAQGMKLVVASLGWRIEAPEQDMHWPRPSDLLVLLGSLWELLKDQHILLVSLALNAVAALLVLAARLRQKGAAEDGAEEDTARKFAALAVVLSPLCNVLVLFALGMSRHPAIARYILAVCVLPLLTAVLLLALAPGWAARLGRGLTVAFVIGLALHQCRLLLPGAREALRPPYPELARAIDRLVAEHGPMRGLAGYWSARHLSYLTHSRTPVLPILLNGMPFPHGSNAQTFVNPRPGEADPPAYHFVVITPGGSLSPPPEIVAMQFGEPARKVRVGPDEVWVYDRLENALFARYLCALEAPRLRREAPFVAPDGPPELARPKGNGTPAASRGVVALGPDQALDVRFPRPVAGRVIDVAADPADRLRLQFCRGGEPVGSVVVPPVPWTAGLPHWPGGLQARLVAVPPEARDRPWDHVVVTSAGPGAGCHVGHLLAYERDVPCLPPSSASVRLPRSFPADGLPSEAPPSSLVADPASSRGRARLSPAGFNGFLSAGPGVTLPAGRYQVEFILAADGAESAEPAALLDVVCAVDGTALAGRTLRGADFAPGGRYSAHRLTFTLAEERELLDFRVQVRGKARVRFDRVELTRCPETDRLARSLWGALP